MRGVQSGVAAITKNSSDTQELPRSGDICPVSDAGVLAGGDFPTGDARATAASPREWRLYLTAKMRLAARVGALALALVLAGGAVAQSVGPDEAVNADGTVAPVLALTPAQENAIYNAVIRQRVRPSPAGVPRAIGEPVPPSLELGDLPDQDDLDLQGAQRAQGETFLKYAMVERDIIIVDPIIMRVIDVIHDRPKP
jgi:hypothetical protein